MKITENENKEIVKKIREGLEKTGGYCRAEYSARLRTSACARNSDAR